MTDQPDIRVLHQRVMTDAWKRANVAMRALFMSSEDTALGAAIAQSRKKGTQFAAILALQWSPIRWLKGRPGFVFEIGQNDFRAMGQDALSEEIDEAVIGAVLDAIDNNVEFIGGLVRDVALGNESPDVYNLQDRGWVGRMMRLV